jgi:putative ABC transport system permease protein
MNALIRKLLGDLKENRGRLFLVGIAIFVGTFAVAAGLGTRAILLREVDASFQRTNPAAAVLRLERLDADLVAQVRLRPGVVEAGARRLVRSRVEVTPGNWQTLLIFGVENFADLGVSIFHTQSGDWPPKNGELLVERSSLNVLSTTQGSTLHVLTLGGTLVGLRVGGIVHDPGLAPGWQDNAGYAYATPATLALLGQGQYLDELRISVAEGVDRDGAAQIAADLALWLDAQGQVVQQVEVTQRKHPHADQMETVILLVQAAGLAALVSGAAITANVTAALLARQIRQIGIIKAIGGTTIQMVCFYLILISVPAVVAIALGVPVGSLAAVAFATVVAGQLNLEVASWAIPTHIFILEVALGVGVPLLAAAVPVLRAARVTARQVIQDAGIVLPSGKIPTFLGWASDRTFVLALRNTFRRPVRLTLTLLALAGGGTLLMTGANVYCSLLQAIDTGLVARGDDLDVRLLRPAPAAELAKLALTIPGVTAAEAWSSTLAAIALPSTQPGNPLGTERYSLLAPPIGTQLLHLPIVKGRWPLSGEGGAIVVNRSLQIREPSLRLGAHITVLAAGRRVAARVVGVVEEVAEPTMYSTIPTLDALLGKPGLASTLRVVTESGVQERVAADMERALVDKGQFPIFSMTRATVRKAMMDHFLSVLLVLTTIASTSMVIGGLALATSMGMGVIERSREIGVLRAIGATPSAVLRIVLTEGIAVAIASALLAVAISIPLSLIVGHLVSKHGIHVAVPLVISPWAVAVWAGLATLIAAIACIWPALAAGRLSVRDILAHE